jgi:quercetin dioxygenase-like cupin family protein
MNTSQSDLPHDGDLNDDELLRPSPEMRKGDAVKLPRRTFLFSAGAAALTVTTPGGAHAEARTTKKKESGMKIKRVGSEPSTKGPADHFTGTVRIDPLFKAPDPARSAGSSVTFEPGARTAWHTHPLGQTLVVTAGCGWAQVEGGPVEEIRPGDVIWFPPGVRHWHGAAAKTAVTHLALQEHLDGKAVEWLEKVTDEEYQAPKTSR